MPLKSGSSSKVISSNIKELHSGKTYARTKAKFGKKDAQRQAVAIALSEARKVRKRADGGGTPTSTFGGMLSQASNPVQQTPTSMFGGQQQDQPQQSPPTWLPSVGGGGVAGPGTSANTGAIAPQASAMPTQTAMVGAPIPQTQVTQNTVPVIATQSGVAPATQPQVTQNTPPVIASPMPNSQTNAAAGVIPSQSTMMGPQQKNNASTTGSAGIGGAPWMGVPANSSVPGSSIPPYNFGNVMRKDGGTVQERAFGGAGLVKTPSMNPTWQERSEARSMTRGPILSAVPGRTDAHFTHVPSGSFVIPADIVSAHGEGNTIAGASALSKMFKMGPYGAGLPKMGGRSSMPRAPKLGTMHSGGGKGGSDKNIGSPVPVKLAGGEIVVPPENLMHVVNPNLKNAHAIMDHWVILERKKLRKTLAKLPPPAKD